MARLDVYMSEEMLEMVRSEAAARRVSMSYLSLECLEEYFGSGRFRAAVHQRTLKRMQAAGKTTGGD